VNQQNVNPQNVNQQNVNPQKPVVNQQQNYNANAPHKQNVQNADLMTGTPLIPASTNKMPSPLIPTSAVKSEEKMKVVRKASDDLAGLYCEPVSSSTGENGAKEQSVKQVTSFSKSDESSAKVLHTPRNFNAQEIKNDVENFNRKVSSLTQKQDGKNSQLDCDWKELKATQERISRQNTTAVGKISSFKNNYQDILPYDKHRVILDSKDDYINASYLKSKYKYCPNFIATQTPMNSSACNDFWLMLFQQQSVLLVTILSANEINEKGLQFWPENGSQMYGSMTVTCTKSNTFEFHTERTFTLQSSKKVSSVPRIVTQMHFTEWPEHGSLPDVGLLIDFKSKVHHYHQQQGKLQWPITVLCNNGVGRSGTFCAIYSSLQQVDCGVFPNVISTINQLRSYRKHIVQHKSQFKFVVDVLYQYANGVMQKHGIVVENPLPQVLPEDSKNKTETKTNEIFDVFNSTTGVFSEISKTVDKMTHNFKSESPEAQQTQIQGNGVASNEALNTQQPPTNAVSIPQSASVFDDFPISPDTFEIGESSKRKKKFTKNDFLNHSSDAVDADDLFTDLDTHWAIKK